MISRRTFTGSLTAAALHGQGDPAASAIHFMTIGQVSALMRRGKLAPVALTKLCLDRIAQLNPKLNAFILVTGDQALEDARKLEAEARAGKWRGPLHGIPVALKDLYDTAGVPTTAASKQWAGRVPSADAEAVRRLKEAGAVVLGKLNMDEFAYNFTGETSSFGTSRNPWNLQRSPGGSSGGSAVAVAAGMCFAALGSDTGGSIRLPAAFCGVTGFKPTYGAVSTNGVAPLAWSLDHVGPLCRTAEDAALVLDALTGHTAPREAVPLAKLRLGVPRSVFYEGLRPEVEPAMQAAAATLGALTAGVRDVTLPLLPPSKQLAMFPDTYVTLITTEAFAFHQEMLQSHPELYHPGTRRSIEGGSSIPAATYIHARRAMEALRDNPDRWFADADLLITPTAPGPAFAFGSSDLVYLRNTAPWNLLGFPTVSIPCGFTPEDLPIGLQITGRPGHDHTVLAAAAAYQRTTQWHQRQPISL